MTTAEVRRVPLAKLEVAEENARYGRPVANVEALAANIATHGLLQPLVGYELKGKVKVCAGARRLAALAFNKAADAPVIVRDRKDAAALSVAENDQRVAMHPAEEAKAWAAMLDKDGDLTALANAFGKTEQFVMQRIKLAGLHTDIFDSFAKNEIGLAVAEAYAGAPPERQAALFKRFGKRSSRWQIREELTKGKLTGDDRLAKFVGEKAYLDAGGKIERDLFANTGTRDETDEWHEEEPEPECCWMDRDIAERLAAEKIQAEVAKHKKDGWGFVEHGEQFPHSKLRQGKACKTPAEKAKAGVFIALERDGSMKIVKNVVKGAEKHGGYGNAVKGAKVKPIGAAAGAKKKQPPMTNLAHETLSRIASRAVGRAMIDYPVVALVAITAQLARARFRWNDAGWLDQDVLDIDVPYDPRRERGKTGEPLKLLSDREFDDTQKRWKDLLAPHKARLEEEIASWDEERRARLFGFLVGARVDCIEESAIDCANHKHRRAKLQALGRLAHVDVGEHWTPTTDWLMGLSKDALTKLCKQLGIETRPQKAKMAEACAIAARDKGWTPPLLLEFVGASEANKAPAKPKGAAKKPGKVLAANTKRARKRTAKVRACRKCGCTDGRACEGGCYWVGPNLCSACA